MAEAKTDKTPDLDPASVRVTKMLEINARIRTVETDISKAEGDLEAAKAEIKSLEAHREKLIAEMREVLEGRHATLFDSVKQASDEVWRSVTLSELGIKGKIAESLTEKELTTLGAISDYINAGKRLIDIPGIGEGAQEKIEKACERYWEKHPQPKDEPESATAQTQQAMRDPDGTLDDFEIGTGIELAYHPDLHIQVMGDTPPEVQVVIRTQQDAEDWLYVAVAKQPLPDAAGEKYLLKRLLAKRQWQAAFAQFKAEDSDLLFGAAVTVEGERYLVCPHTDDIVVAVEKE